MQAPAIPTDPLARLLELFPAVAQEKRWVHEWSMLRFATVGLLCVPGDSAEIARRLFARAEELKAGMPWYSSLKSNLRFTLAAGLVRSGMDARRFTHVLDATRSKFREVKLPRGEVEEALATLVLVHETPDALPDLSRVRRMARTYAGMREHHPFLTGRDDLATAAMLSGSSASVEDVTARIEGIYKALRRQSFYASNALQLASHLLYFAPGAEGAVARRFHGIYHAFKQAGLWMGSEDYDEVALLAYGAAAPADLVRSVVEVRAGLRDQLSPRPSKQEGFSLAAGVVFLKLASDDQALAKLHHVQLLVSVAGIVTAQQAAAVAAAGAAAAASG